jgi:glycosyltransferase involved in cell wall biosynthesis
VSARVLIVSPFGPPHRGGLEAYIEWLSSSLAGHGADVRMLSTDVREVDADFAVHALDVPVGGGTSWPLVLGSPRDRAVISDAVRWSDLVIHQNCFWNLTALASRAAARLHRRQFTVVHAAYRTYPGAGHLTGAFAWAYARGVGRAQLRRAPAIAVSQSTRRFIESEYGTSALLAPCPLPAPEGSGRRSAHRDGGEALRIAWVGRLVPVKAPAVAIAVGDALAARYSFEMHMYGDGPLQAELPSRPWLRLHGALPREEVLDEVAQADLFLSTSRADNVQVALLEALSLGVPCVATRVGEAEDYLSGALSQGLVEIDDVAGMVNAIERVLAEGPQVRRESLRRGAQLAIRHDPDAAARRVIEVLGL